MFHLTDTLASIKHRPDFNVWIITVFVMVIKKYRINPEPAAGGKRLRESHTTHQIRFGPFYDQTYSVCHCLTKVLVQIFITKMYLITKNGISKDKNCQQNC